METRRKKEMQPGFLIIMAVGHFREQMNEKGKKSGTAS
jgi:hypothetical protein